VTAFKEGQRVTSLGWLGHDGSGSWQQYINVPAERVVALPDGISDEAGAQFYVRLALFAAAGCDSRGKAQEGTSTLS
jgi:NADPH:quinone reductase-like Zn-dependent oxidoreductase